jgi:hypothetical protein
MGWISGICYEEELGRVVPKALEVEEPGGFNGRVLIFRHLRWWFPFNGPMRQQRGDKVVYETKREALEEATKEYRRHSRRYDNINRRLRQRT